VTNNATRFKHGADELADILAPINKETATQHIRSMLEMREYVAPTIT
jgi:hypothetical protein